VTRNGSKSSVSSYTEEQEPEQGKKSAIVTVCSSDGKSSVLV
jgi:hypothetical protein